MNDLHDPLPLAQALIRCASITPADAGAQTTLADALRRLGFTVTPLRYGQIENLFARIGTGSPHICFAGHTDVVPVGNANWQSDPFGSEVRNDILYGRGACDMKGAIAAFVAAAAQLLADGPPRGSISLLITGDEEGPAVDGTVRVLEWMQANGQIPDFCVVGEPTCPVALGDMVKIGRRGSLNAKITVHGTQGHVAYPQRADNPVHRLIRIADALTAAPLDAGNEWFQPSSLQFTSIDVGNPVTNVIPATASAMLNVRFNSDHTGAALSAWLRAVIAQHAERFRPGHRDQRRIVPDGAWRIGEHAAPGNRECKRRAAEARYGRRYVGCPLHRPLLSSRGVRAGWRFHASGGRARAGC